MRILHLSDLHAVNGHFEWVIKEQARYDLVCITGDLLDANPLKDVGDQLGRVIRHLERIRKPLALCSGNHDSLAGAGPRLEHAQWLRELRGPNVWIDGEMFEFGEFKFRCIPWNGFIPEVQSEEIWLMHAPPGGAKTAIARGGINWGDLVLGDLCRAALGPALALSGHIHDPQAHFSRVGRTWSLNPGCAEKASTPNHNIIDLGRGVAFHHRASGETDAVRLWLRK